MESSETAPATRRDEVLVDLGLQGGGSHGAFTWGGSVTSRAVCSTSSATWAF
jgi:hypothetical protein